MQCVVLECIDCERRVTRKYDTQIAKAFVVGGLGSSPCQNLHPDYETDYTHNNKIVDRVDLTEKELQGDKDLEIISRRAKIAGLGRRN